MDAKAKQQWTEEEIQFFLALWSSSEVQNKLEGAFCTKPVLEKLQREMAAAGYERTLEQLINKLKKLKNDYRDQKKELDRSGSGRPKRNPHFDLLHSILADRPANQTTGALNSATATQISVVDESVIQATADNTDTELLAMEDDTKLSGPLVCSSPSQPLSSSSSSSHRTRAGKRKRDTSSDLLEYLERSEQRFLEQSRRDQDNAMTMMTMPPPS